MSLKTSSQEVSKMYRKLISMDSEYHAFRLIERLDANMCRQILQTMVYLKIKNTN